MSVAVAVDDKLVWAEGFELADLEQCVPASPKPKFRIGSTSKPLTSAAAALLFDQGRLDLDAPVQRYVPNFPDKGHVITTRQLLGHLAGIRGYNAADGEIEKQQPYASVAESLKRFKDDPLVAEPGTKWVYSNLSYKWAGGGFLSTVEDLARCGSALLRPGFLKQDTLAMIFTHQKTSTGAKTKVKYGLGWDVHEPGDPIDHLPRPKRGDRLASEQ